jgi:hypothetical protein
MSLSDPFNDLQPMAVGVVPLGTCDGLQITVDGTIDFTTMKGTAIVGFPVVAGQVVSCRVKSVQAIASAAGYFGYHKA